MQDSGIITSGRLQAKAIASGPWADEQSVRHKQRDSNPGMCRTHRGGIYNGEVSDRYWKWRFSVRISAVLRFFIVSSGKCQNGTSSRQHLIRNWWPTRCNFFVYLFVPNQLYMFRTMFSPITRNAWLYNSFWYSPPVLLPAGVMDEMELRSITNYTNDARTHKQKKTTTTSL